MKKEINPRETSRAAAFELWMSSPMPMVTLTKTFDVSRILKISRKRGWNLFCNPMLMWGSYRRGFFRTTLPISFQFHHVQMDGSEAARFLELLQAIINL